MDEEFEQELIQSEDVEVEESDVPADDPYRDVRRFARLVKKIVRTDMDACIGVSGYEGVGKSVLILLIAILMDKKFSLLRNVIFMPTEDEIKDKIFTMDRYSPVCLDEAMKVLYKRGWQTKERRNLNILFSICRKRNLAFFLAIPNFWDLDPYYRNHRVKIWIFIPVRGRALVFLKDSSPFVDDPWWKVYNQKAVAKAMKKSIIGDRELLISALKKSKNYAFEIRFPDLPEDIKKEYLSLNAQHFGDMENEMNSAESSKTKEFKARIDRAVIMLSKKGWTARKIAELFNYTAASIGAILRANKVSPSDKKLEGIAKIDSLPAEAERDSMVTEDILAKEDAGAGASADTSSSSSTSSDSKTEDKDNDNSIIREVLG